MSGQPLHEVWNYEGSDPGIMLFSAALKAWQLQILPGQRVLEIGCNESDFLPRLHRAMPSLQLTGLDWRPSDKQHDGYDPGYRFVQGCAWDETLFDEGAFDWVLLLGALEHFGLGWYGDPREPKGDEYTIDAMAKWLITGGQAYFDVPCNPEPQRTAHFRTYTPHDVARRLWIEKPARLEEVARGYSLPEPHAGTWVPQPTVHRTPYHYVAIWAQRE